jgi:hypothetical protein
LDVSRKPRCGAIIHIEDATDLDLEQVLSVQHGIDGRREQSQVPEPGSAAIVKETAYPLQLSRREPISFARPDADLARRLPFTTDKRGLQCRLAA